VIDTLDRHTLAELLDAVGGDEEFVDDLVQTYLADSPALLDEIDAAVAADDPARMVTPAHTLKSNSLTVGATQLAAIARVLEEQSRGGSMASAAERAAAARAELDLVQAELEAARADGWRP